MAAAPGFGEQDQNLSESVQHVVHDFVDRFYADTEAARFAIAPEDLVGILTGIVRRCPVTLDSADLFQFLDSLRLEELILARACAAGNDEAWDVFVRRYRASLRTSAFRMCPDPANAFWLADSLYTGLFGIDEAGRERRAKLLYYEGRGSLEGWLRTVLAQEYVDARRRTRHDVSLDERMDAGVQFEAAGEPQSTCDARLERATELELARLDDHSRFLLAAHYLDGRTLAEIARLLHVHESTISRKLERIRAGLRQGIRRQLLAAGMSPREADETMQDADVGALQIEVRKTLEQESQDTAFYRQGQKGTE